MKNENNQHKIYIIGFLLIVLVIVWSFLKPFVSNWKNGQKDNDGRKANEEILKAPSVMPDDLLAEIQKKSKILIVDVSTPEDFKRGHIATAVNVLAERLNKDFFKNIGAETMADIFIINQGNDLAGLAATTNKVISAGFANAKYLRGGVAGWMENGYPLVSLGGSDMDSAKVKKITIDEIKKELGGNSSLFQFIDVRDSESFSKDHISGAINIPVPEIESRKNEISSLKKAIVYGANGSESFQAAVVLFDLNFFNIYQMDGSFENWKAAGGNVE